MLIRTYARGGKQLFELMEERPTPFGILFLLIGIAMSAYYFGHVYPIKSAIFGSGGQETAGNIESMYQSSDRSNVIYYAEVSYQDASGQQHLVRNTYSMTKWYALKDNHDATIRYLKKDPAVAVETHSKEGEPPSLLWYVLGCGTFVLLGLVLIIYGRSVSREEAEALEVSPPSYTTNHRPPPARPLG